MDNFNPPKYEDCFNEVGNFFYCYGGCVEGCLYVLSAMKGGGIRIFKTIHINNLRYEPLRADECLFHKALNKENYEKACETMEKILGGGK